MKRKLICFSLCLYTAAGINTATFLASVLDQMVAFPFLITVQVRTFLMTVLEQCLRNHNIEDY